MPRTTAFAEGLHELVYENDASNAVLAAIGDGIRASVTAGSLYLALFTASPGAAGSQSNEADYTGYARVAISRAGGSWTTSGNATENTSVITFAACTGGSNTITHAAIMSASSTGQMLEYFALSSSLAVSNGVTPSVPAGDFDVTEDVTL